MESLEQAIVVARLDVTGHHESPDRPGVPAGERIVIHVKELGAMRHKRRAQDAKTTPRGAPFVADLRTH
jgi:hypothetical protein